MKRGVIITLVIVVIALIALISFMRYFRSAIQEIKQAEFIKGEWVVVQEFVKDKGRYPDDHNELAAYFNYVPSDEIVYLKPTNDAVEEIIFYWKEPLSSGERVCITEKGIADRETP